MRFRYGTRYLEVFTLVPRTMDQRLYWKNILEIIRLSDRYEYSGALIFTGHDVFVEPWLAAQTMIGGSRSLMPLVAVNPIYMHPFTAAKMVSSLAYVYGRKVFLNLVTGTALNYLDAFGDTASHDERYERLLEYATIVNALLGGEPVSHAGRFYAVRQLQLLPAVPPELRPGYVVAGQSPAAQRVARALGATSLQMLPPTLEAGLAEARGLNLGIVTRLTEAEAWRAARERFPDDPCGQAILADSMSNTDSEWKRRLKIVAGQQAVAKPGFWMGPFTNFQADQPFFVGSHAQVAALLTSIIRAGVELFVLDVPPDDTEFENIAVAFQAAAEQIQAAATVIV